MALPSLARESTKIWSPVAPVTRGKVVTFENFQRIMANKVILTRKNDHVHFEATDEEGLTVQIDGGPGVGGEGKGVRPMQLLLMGLGGCSSIDVVEILRKQRQQLDDIQVEVIGDRDTSKVPSPYTDIEVIFDLKGEIDPAKAQRAVDLSIEKYCSVAKTLETFATIKAQVRLNGKTL